MNVLHVHPHVSRGHLPWRIFPPRLFVMIVVFSSSICTMDLHFTQ